MPAIYKICSDRRMARRRTCRRVQRLSGRSARRLHPFLDRRAGDRDRSEAFFRPVAILCSSASTPRRWAISLKWEPSRGGALFPHLYGDLRDDGWCGASIRCRSTRKAGTSSRNYCRSQKSYPRCAKVTPPLPALKGPMAAKINRPLTINWANSATGELFLRF